MTQLACGVSSDVDDDGLPDLTDADVARARAVLTDTGALAAVEDEIAHSTRAAIDQLVSAPITAGARLALENLARAAADRAA